MRIKVLSLLLALLLFALPCLANEAAPEEIVITLALSNAGQVELAMIPLTVTDEDQDGAITIHDALLLAHKEYCPDGFTAQETDYGLSITKLWGVENGGSYGYVLNHEPATSLTQVLASGDILYAYSFADLVSWSDAYSYFISSQGDGQVPTQLIAIGYDESWTPIRIPVANAVLTVNGEESSVCTQSDGTFDLAALGELETGTILSAVSKDQTLVPPIYRYNPAPQS